MSNLVQEAPRRQLSGRNPEMVDRLLEAAVSEVAATGYDGLTVRNVARAAGVSPATAYTYFGSKEHLLAAVFRNRVAALPPLDLGRGTTVAEAVEAALSPVAMLVADEPELAAGVTTALLAHDSDVRVLREQIGLLMSERLVAALGPKAPPEVQLGLSMAFTGGLLSAGMGILDYRALGPMVADLATRVMGRKRS
jgi:AcrR family transcriptional regulator